MKANSLEDVQRQVNEYMKNFEKQHQEMLAMLRKKEVDCDEKLSINSKEVLQDYRSKYELDRLARDTLQSFLGERLDSIVRECVYDMLRSDAVFQSQRETLLSAINNVDEIEKQLFQVSEENIYTKSEEQKEALHQEINHLRILKRNINTQKVKDISAEDEPAKVHQIQQYVKDKTVKYFKRFLSEFKSAKTLGYLRDQRCALLKEEISKLENNVNDERLHQLEQQVRDGTLKNDTACYDDIDERNDDESIASDVGDTEEVDIVIPENEADLGQDEINKTYYYKIQNFATDAAKYVVYAHLADPFDQSFPGFIYFFDVANSKKESDRKMKFYAQYFPEFIRIASARFSSIPYNVKTDISSLSLNAELDMMIKNKGEFSLNAYKDTDQIKQLEARRLKEKNESERKLTECFENNATVLGEQKRQRQAELDNVIGGVGVKKDEARSMGTVFNS